MTKREFTQQLVYHFTHDDTPSSFLKLSIEKNELCEFVPEFMACVGFDQRNKYHYQTVDEHTYSVLDNCKKDLTIRLVAFLHDISKPVCNNVNKYGGLSYIGHDIASADMSFKILTRLGFDENIIYEVYKMIFNHQVVYSKNDMFVKFADFEGYVSFLKADILAHLEPNLDKLDVFVGNYSKERRSEMDYANKSDKLAYIMIGIPRSGKTTTANSIKSINKNVEILNADSIRKNVFGVIFDAKYEKQVWEIHEKMFMEYIRKNCDIIVDNTNITAKTRKPLIKKLKENGYTVIAIRVLCHPTLCIQRSKETTSVPDTVILKMYSSLDEPTFEEGFDSIINHKTD